MDNHEYKDASINFINAINAAANTGNDTMFDHLDNILKTMFAAAIVHRKHQIVYDILIYRLQKHISSKDICKMVCEYFLF